MLNAIKDTEEYIKKRDNAFKQKGFARNESQRILVMIGKTGGGKSTLGNRICGDKSKKGNQGPFGVSARMTTAGTTDVTSRKTTAPFDHLEIKTPDDTDEDPQAPSVLIVDAPGWGYVEADNRELCYSFQICLDIYFVYTQLLNYSAATKIC